MGVLHLDMLWNLGYLLLFTLIFFPLALIAMHRRLIR
jgi:hypothetical protein